MILTYREIEIALSNRQIIVEPPPNLAEALSSTTLDLRLSDIFAEWTAIVGTTIHPGAPDYSYEKLAPLQKKL